MEIELEVIKKISHGHQIKKVIVLPIWLPI